jgi:multiple sugar transport system substrate-binding protein
VFPGSLALNANEARAQTAQGVVGMILQGPWNIPTWQASNPEFDFGVASQPVPNTGDPLPLTVGPGGSNAFWIYAKSPNQQIAADIFHYLGTPEGQTNWAKRVGIADAATFPEAMAAANLDERSQKAADLFTDQIRQGPDPRVKNPEAEAIFAEMKPLTPNFGATIQGLFAGAISDVKGALQDLQDRSDAELDRAIAAAQAKGANVSRDDFVFPNWDPSTDYTAELYDAL